jgi:hypothetical protein
VLVLNKAAITNNFFIPFFVICVNVLKKKRLSETCKSTAKIRKKHENLGAFAMFVLNFVIVYGQT